MQNKPSYSRRDRPPESALTGMALLVLFSSLCWTERKGVEGGGLGGRDCIFKIHKYRGEFGRAGFCL